jgi:hypothetical protein
VLKIPPIANLQNVTCNIMKTVILTLFLLLTSTLYGQKSSGFLKVDFDTTIIYTDYMVLLEMLKDYPDSIGNLMFAKDTIVTTDLKILLSGNKKYNFNIEQGLKRILKKNYSDIYYKGKVISKYKIKKVKNDIYYIDSLTNKTFLQLKNKV